MCKKENIFIKLKRSILANFLWEYTFIKLHIIILRLPYPTVSLERTKLIGTFCSKDHPSILPDLIARHLFFVIPPYRFLITNEISQDEGRAITSHFAKSNPTLMERDGNWNARDRQETFPKLNFQRAEYFKQRKREGHVLITLEC